MNQEDTKKIVWEVLTEFEKLKGQIQEQFTAEEIALKKQEAEALSSVLTELANRDEKVAEALKTSTTATLEHFHNFAVTLHKMMEMSNKESETVADALVKVAEAVAGLRGRIDEVEKLIISKLDKEKSDERH